MFQSTRHELCVECVRSQASDINSDKLSDSTVILLQWRTEGVFGVFNPPPPRNSEGPRKNRAKLNPIVKTVKKIAEFRTPTHQDVRKRGSKILKLPKFAIVLH